jgi:hypothetical protein
MFEEERNKLRRGSNNKYSVSDLHPVRPKKLMPDTRKSEEIHVLKS